MNDEGDKTYSVVATLVVLVVQKTVVLEIFVLQITVVLEMENYLPSPSVEVKTLSLLLLQ